MDGFRSLSRSLIEAAALSLLATALLYRASGANRAATRRLAVRHVVATRAAAGADGHRARGRANAGLADDAREARQTPFGPAADHHRGTPARYPARHRSVDRPNRGAARRHEIAPHAMAARRASVVRARCRRRHPSRPGPDRRRRHCALVAFVCRAGPRRRRPGGDTDRPVTGPAAALQRARARSSRSKSGSFSTNPSCSSTTSSSPAAPTPRIRRPLAC